MKYKVIENHRTEYPNPLLLSQDEKVIIGEESGEDWPNWVFCTKLDKSNSGWVPKQIILYENDFGVIVENYSAKELDIDIGTIVEGIMQLNGWLWSKNMETSEIGWIPLEKMYFKEYVTKTEKDEEALSELIKQSWRSDIIVSRGKKYKVEDLEGILTYENGIIIGLGLYYIINGECEIVLLEALIQKQGIGTRIIEKIKEIAVTNKCKRLWLITSNDNIDAIKFYQRRGFCISNFYKNAMEESRKLKPEIPLIGEYEIPIRDEIEFEMEIYKTEGTSYNKR